MQNSPSDENERDAASENAESGLFPSVLKSFAAKTRSAQYSPPESLKLQ